MGIIQFIVIAVVLGLIAWAATAYIPMPAAVKKIIIIAVVVVLAVILLKAMGLFPFEDVAIPRMN